MEGNIQSSLQILQETEKFAKEKGLKILEKEIDAEKTLLVEKYDQMESLIKSDVSMFEKLKEIKINQYIKAAMESIPSLDKKHVQQNSTVQNVLQVSFSKIQV